MIERWYKDRIGGMFTANAEALADLALQQPSVGMAEVGFTCEGRSVYAMPSKVCGAKITGADGKIEGWSKVAHPENAGKQVFIGMLATLIGAPSAPYIYLRGIDRIFSPECFDHICVSRSPNEWRANLASANVQAVAAAGQFRSWIHDTDGFTSNSAFDLKKGSFYLFDHEFARPERHFEYYHNKDLVSFGKEAAAAKRQGKAYNSAAEEMAFRIYSLNENQILNLESVVQKASFKIEQGFAKESFAGQLIAKRIEFSSPKYMNDIFQP